MEDYIMLNLKQTLAFGLTAAMVFSFVPGTVFAASEGEATTESAGISASEDTADKAQPSETAEVTATEEITKTVATNSGWKKVSGKWYYYDKNGRKVTGFQKIDGKLYSFNKKGVMLYGWQKSTDGKWYYFGKDGSASVSKWIKPDGHWYYLDQDGIMVTGIAEIDGEFYKFKSSGVLTTGWSKNADGSWYYFTVNGAAKGWKTIGGVKYYFDEETALMATGWQEIDAYTYVFEDSGAMKKSCWVEDEEGNVYYLTENGTIKVSGWATIGGEKYFFNENGIKVTGFQTIDDELYCFAASGAMKKSCWVTDIEGNYYYLLESGVAKKSGWILINSDYYYLDDSGKMLTGLQTIGGYTYYFYPLGKDEGKMAKNIVINDMHFDKNGHYDYQVVKDVVWHAKPMGSYAFGSEEADDNAKLICSLLMLDYGWTFEACCGLLGNIAGEGGLNPWQWEISLTNNLGRIPTRDEAIATGKGYGLIGWTPARKYFLDDATTSKGITWFPNYHQSTYDGYGPNFFDQEGNIEDGKAQTKFIGELMKNSNSNIWIRRKSCTQKEYIALTSVEDAAYYWLWNAEYPSTLAYPDKAPATEARRQNYAIDWYNRLGGSEFKPVVVAK